MNGTGGGRAVVFERWVAHHGWPFWAGLLVAASVVAQIPGIGPLLFLVVVAWGLAYQLTARRRHRTPLTPARPVAVSWAVTEAKATDPGPSGVSVVGTQYYGGWGRKRGHSTVTLVREPNNPHDPNAIAVFAGASQIGHLPRERAALIAPLIDASGQTRVGATAYFEEHQARITLPNITTPNLAPAADALRLSPVEPWGRCDREFEIAFESEHRSEVAAVFRDNGMTITNEGVVLNDIEATLTLSQHPTSPAVLIGGRWVGNVTDPQFAPYLAELERLAGSRHSLQVPARVWARNDYGTTRSNVRIYMPPLNEIEAPGPMPEGLHILLPREKKVQVTGEEQHLAEVSALLAGSSRQPVVATLHVLPAASARSTKERVQVRVYGEAVGFLTPTMAEHFVPLLKACEEEGVAVACHAVVKGNQLKADVELDTVRAGDLGDDWISHHLYGAAVQRDADDIVEAALAASELPPEMWLDETQAALARVIPAENSADDDGDSDEV